MRRRDRGSLHNFHVHAVRTQLCLLVLERAVCLSALYLLLRVFSFLLLRACVSNGQVLANSLALCRLVKYYVSSRILSSRRTSSRSPYRYPFRDFVMTSHISPSPASFVASRKDSSSNPLVHFSHTRLLNCSGLAKQSPLEHFLPPKLTRNVPERKH